MRDQDNSDHGGTNELQLGIKELFD